MSDNEIVERKLEAGRTPPGKDREGGEKSITYINFVHQFISFAFWIYVILKLFIFDFDFWLVARFFPQYMWILSFKFIFVPLIISLMIIFIGLKGALISIGYILLYPWYLLFLRLPYLILKQKNWVLTFVIFNYIAAFCYKFKTNCLVFTALILCWASIFFSISNYVTVMAIGVLTALVVFSYVRGFISAIRPGEIFRLYSRFFPRTRSFADKLFVLDDDVRGLPLERLADKQIEKWNSGLQFAVLFNRSCLFFAVKLREYQKSEWRIIPSILSLIFLIFFAVFNFSIINFGLFKVDPAQYQLSISPEFFSFVYYSFNNLIFNSTPGMESVGKWAQLVRMLQESLAFFVVAILVTLAISQRDKRHVDELSEIIAGVEQEGKRMEEFIEREYSIEGVKAAMEYLNNLKFGMIAFIYWLSTDING